MTKIYVLLLVAAGTVLSVTAQPFVKGDKLLGGSIGYSLSRSNITYSQPTPTPDYRYFNFNISPSLGFFTKPNRLSGFSLQFNYGSSFPDNIDYRQKNVGYGAGFYKQYWNSLGKNFYFIIQGRVGASYANVKYFNSTQKDESRTGTAYLTIDPGFAYRMKKRLVLDAYYTNFLYTAFAYTDRRGNNGVVSKEYTINANTGLQNFSLGSVVLGFRYLL